MQSEAVIQSLCFADCAKHRPGQRGDCRIVAAIMRSCVKFGITAVVRECPHHVSIRAAAPITLRERILALVSPEPNSGCWLWMGAVSSDGYGIIRADRRSQPAHRLAYIAFKGQIPDGMTIDHLCRVRGCVNPDHLEAVTNAENARRAAVLQVRGVCKRGHSPTPENTYLRKGRKGWADCLECRRIRKREARAAGANW